MTEQKLKAGLVQQHNSGDRADNMNRLKQSIEQCAAQGAQLVVRFGQKLSGPEYADRFVKQVESSNIATSLLSYVIDIKRLPEGGFVVTYICRDGVKHAECKSLVLATGCRERTRNAVNTLS